MDAVASAVAFPVVERTSADPVADPVGQMEAILAGLDRTIRGEGRAFGVLVFPSALTYEGDAGELRNYREVLDVLRRLGIPFADYYERTRDASWEDLFFGLQDHWRSSGHEEAASLVRELLATLGASRQPAPPPVSPGQETSVGGLLPGGSVARPVMTRSQSITNGAS
jgi:hypothetical protein